MEALIYLDTHVVVWLAARQTGRLSDHAARRIEDEDLLISPIVALELEYLSEVGRLRSTGGEIVQRLQVEIGLRSCELSFPRIVQSALAQSWTRDPFDRVIVGHAAAADATLLSADETICRHYAKAEW